MILNMKPNNSAMYTNSHQLISWFNYLLNKNIKYTLYWKNFVFLFNSFIKCKLFPCSFRTKTSLNQISRSKHFLFCFLCFLWVSVGSSVFSMVSRGFCGFLSVFSGFSGFLWIPLCFLWLLWVSLCFLCVFSVFSLNFSAGFSGFSGVLWFFL